MGVELDSSFRATDTLNITFDAAYIDARFDRYPGAPCYGTTTVGVTPTPAPVGCFKNSAGQFVQDNAGKTMPNAPKFKFTLSADQRIPLPGPFDLSVNGSYAYRTRAQMLPDNNPQAIQRAFGILNLGATLATKDKTYSLSLFVNNVTDQHYVVDAEDFWNGPWAGHNTVIVQPARDSNRYFGARLSARF